MAFQKNKKTKTKNSEMAIRFSIEMCFRHASYNSQNTKFWLIKNWNIAFDNFESEEIFGIGPNKTWTVSL